ncbi:ectoine/hydroxyectoine ABC transporter substrate-binding protein EhuB [Marininema halotolerans]|uniref:ectoine/hydroxyectoine ABC transporter substrate-binding protein EhuB n=1 Tax=Marininema halotolerans TaxID=1155944 RepID=UPI001FEB067A|nr:ectoine/hydroxyectoine ABC transporter substrate-binding protein EhuB [Marininema halotolerans]
MQFFSSGESALQEAKDQKSVVIGFANEKPYAYQEDGKVTGEAVEIAKKIFKNQGITNIKPVLTDFGSLIPGLKAGRFDVITAGMYITPERCKQVAFANPEYNIGEGLAVQKGNPKDIHSYKDVANQPDTTIAVMKGAIEESYMKDSGVKENQIKFVADQPTAVALLNSGRVDGVTMTGPSLLAILQSAKAKNVSVVEDFKQPIIDGKEIKGIGAAAFRPEDKDFVKIYNDGLAQMKESGELYDTIHPFGFTKKDLPGDETAEEICKQ